MTSRFKPLTGTGPLVDFARDLRALYAPTGLTFKRLSRATGYTSAELSRAFSGKELPRLKLLCALVRACDGNMTHWCRRWRVLRALRQRGEAVHIPDTIHQPTIDFVARLAKLRDSEGVTYRKIAQTYRCSQDTAHRYLQPSAKLPPLTFVECVARLCGADVELWRSDWQVVSLGATTRRQAAARNEAMVLIAKAMELLEIGAKVTITIEPTPA